jgi:hypothetical protein
MENHSKWEDTFIRRYRDETSFHSGYIPDQELIYKVGIYVKGSGMPVLVKWVDKKEFDRLMANVS